TDAAGCASSFDATRRKPSSTPCAMPRDGSSGVEGTFQTSTRPSLSSNRQMSVNVPPESTPTRQRDIIPSSVAPHPRTLFEAQKAALTCAAKACSVRTRQCPKELVDACRGFRCERSEANASLVGERAARTGPGRHAAALREMVAGGAWRDSARSPECAGDSLLDRKRRVHVAR